MTARLLLCHAYSGKHRAIVAASFWYARVSANSKGTAEVASLVIQDGFNRAEGRTDEMDQMGEESEERKGRTWSRSVSDIELSKTKQAGAWTSHWFHD